MQVTRCTNELYFFFVLFLGPGWLISDDKTKAERETYALALKSSFLLLQDVIALVDRNDVTTSLNSNDVEKNLAVSSARYAFLVATLSQSNDHQQAAVQAVQAVQRFLEHNPKDAAAAVFSQILPILLQTSQEAKPKKQRKSKKKKKKKKKKNRD